MSPETEEAWARGFFETMDRLTPALLDSFLDEGVRFRFANLDAVHGREGVRATMGQIAAIAERIHHDISGIWRGVDGDASVICVESMVTYSLRSGADVRIPATSNLRIRNGKIVDYRIFADPSPLFGDQP